jgi:hypothetical protein
MPTPSILRRCLLPRLVTPSRRALFFLSSVAGDTYTQATEIPTRREGLYQANSVPWPSVAFVFG